MTRSSWSLSTRIISVQMSGQGPCARYKLLSDLIIDESDFLFHEIIYRFFILHKDTDPGLQRKTIPSTSTVIVSSQMTTLSTENSSQNVQQERKRTPLPKLQLFITNLIQFAEPVTALVIYPFINQFVRDTGITNGTCPSDWAVGPVNLHVILWVIHKFLAACHFPMFAGKLQW